MKQLLLISCLALLYSCDINENGDDLFGGGASEPQSSDWFGGEEPPLKKVKIDTIIEKIDNKTIGEKLLDVSVSIKVFDSKGNPVAFGSGVFIKSNIIVTNVHVIEGGSLFVATRNSDGKKFDLEVYKQDISHDVAILLTKNFNSLEFLKINSKFPRIGNEIWVAGSPMGQEGTISNGIISAIRKVKPYDFDLIQFTAPISFGSSGGPLINPNMDLIGITVSGIDRNDAQNLNFAVPSKYISHLLDEENN